MLQALRIRDFRLLWVGGLVSSFGSWLLTLAQAAGLAAAASLVTLTAAVLARLLIPADAPAAAPA